MPRFVKIGNISDLSAPSAPSAPMAAPAGRAGRKLGGGVFKRLGLGERTETLAKQTLDLGQQRAKSAISAMFGEEPAAPSRGPGAGLEAQMSEDQVEEALAGLGQALSVVGQLRGAQARRCRQMIEGVVAEIAGPLDHSGATSGGLAAYGGGGGVDVIGLDGSGGVQTGAFDPGEWR